MYPGNIHDVTTVVEFLATAERFGIKNGTIIWDRVLTTKDPLGIAQANGYHLIAGLPATQDIAVHPVRHRIPARVRSYIFVCVLGYYLRAFLAAKLRNTKQESFDDFLNDLADIQRTILSYGKSKSIRYLNVGVKTRSVLRALGLSSMFRQVNILPRV